MRFLAGIVLASTLIFSGGVYGYGYNSPALRPGTVSITERGGIDPTVFAYLQEIDVVNFVSLSEALVVVTVADENPITTFTVLDTALVQTESKRASKFKDMFDQPWMAGGEFALALNCSTEIFIDGSYSSAEGKQDHYKVIFPAVAGVLDATAEGFATPTALKPRERVHIKEKYSDLDCYRGHLGGRYYFPCSASCFHPFVGTKIGFCHWNTVKAKVRGDFEDDVNGTVNFNIGEVTYYPAHTVISAGFQLGCNFVLSQCLSIVFTVEAIGTGTFKFGNSNTYSRGTINSVAEAGGTFNAVDREAATVLQVPVRRTGTVLSFPVHLGLRFTF